MRTIIDYLTANWSIYTIPLAVFVFTLIALFWLRKMALDYLEKWVKRTRWTEDDILMQAVRGPASLFCLTLSIYLGLTVSSLTDSWKDPLGHVIWTLFLLALTLALLNLARGLVQLYGRKFNLPDRCNYYYSQYCPNRNPGGSYIDNSGYLGSADQSACFY